jgi:exo-beta-1,3-glucanase (GH17 family)
LFTDTGDEPLYDNDAGSALKLAKYLSDMKADLAKAGLSDIPVSISEMAYGWQISSDFQSLIDELDFFMINTFPYFVQDAKEGGSDVSWADFTNDIKYYESIAQGKPLLVTQVSLVLFSHSLLVTHNVALRPGGRATRTHGRLTVLTSSCLSAQRRPSGTY